MMPRQLQGRRKRRRAARRLEHHIEPLAVRQLPHSLLEAGGPRIQGQKANLFRVHVYSIGDLLIAAGGAALVYSATRRPYAG
jgi:hypothetical protein